MRKIYVSSKLRIAIKTYLDIAIILTWLWIYLKLSVQRLSTLQLSFCRERGNKYVHENYKPNIRVSSVESVNVFSKEWLGWQLLIFWPRRQRRFQIHKTTPFSNRRDSMNRGPALAVPINTAKIHWKVSALEWVLNTM